MKIFNCLLLFTLLMLVCSCAEIKQQKETNIEHDEVVLEEKPSIEGERREPVFVYNNQSTNLPKKIFLTLNDKPQLVSDGYIKLLGVVLGSPRVALVDLAGQERCLQPGEDFNGYRVIGITEKGIKLQRKEK